MNYCDTCEYYDDCELAGNINFCEDCRDCATCTIKYVYCKAGYEIECNNGFESKVDVWDDDYTVNEEDNEEF